MLHIVFVYVFKYPLWSKACVAFVMMIIKKILDWDGRLSKPLTSNTNLMASTELKSLSLAMCPL